MNKNSALARKGKGPSRGMCRGRNTQEPRIITLQLGAHSHTAHPSPTTRTGTPFQEDNTVLGRLSPNAAVCLEDLVGRGYC